MKATRTRSFDIHLPGTKETPPEFIETIEVGVFDQFGEEFLTPESSERIEGIKARHMGLLTGEDIKAMRKRLGLTQDQLSDLLQCGKKSLSRWENGRGYPTGIVNKLLRLLDEGFIAPASLEAVSGPRSELSSERFLRNRRSNVVTVDFGKARAQLPESSDPDEEYLQTAASS